MVLWAVSWYIEKDKLKEYAKFAKEEAIPFWMMQKGMNNQANVQLSYLQYIMKPICAWQSL